MAPWPLAPLVVLTAVGGLAAAGILALAGRGAQDPGARRIDAVYLFTVLSVTLFLALFSAAGAVGGALALAVPRAAVWAVSVGSSGGWRAVPAELPLVGGEPASRVVVYSVVAGPDRVRPVLALAVLAVAASLAYRWHARRARELVAEAGFAGSAASRVHRAYVNLVCAAALLVLIFASVPVVLGLVGAILPGGFSPVPEGRGVGLVRLAWSVVLAAGAFAIFRSHWARRGERSAPGSASAP